jgi:hypothetical protein
MMMKAKTGMWSETLARQGSEYERFVYEKFRRFFADSKVTLNDRILGKQSSLLREIDISIRINISGEEVLYIVQCKDRGKRPADILILGEFSSVIRDVEAAKGFLICTSGFAKSNHQYAESLGIELLTVEDIESNRWHADVQIPLIYIKKTTKYYIDGAIVVNDELAAKNRDRELVVKFDIDNKITFDNGATSTTIKDHVQTLIARAGAFLKEVVDFDLWRPGIRLNFAGVWVECSELRINLTITRKYYLKYLTPDQYSQIRDHRRDITLPVHVSVGGPSQLDDSFIEVSPTAPVKAVIIATIEEWTDIERAQGKGQVK